MLEQLWITPTEALVVLVSTTVMYAALVVLVRLLGQRILSSLSSFDLAAVIAFGSVIARAALGETPRLAAGLVALVTLVLLQGGVGLVRRRSWGARAVVARPYLLMAGGRVIGEHLDRCHVLPEELQSRLRLAGVRHPEEVTAVVFEPQGGMSVLKRGVPVDPMLLSGVVGASRVPDDLMSHPEVDDQGGPVR